MSEKFIIDDRIFNLKFSCDVSKCRGACCTLKGAGGAPLLDEEVRIIKRNTEIARKYLSVINIFHIDTGGVIEGEPGDYSLKSVNDEECIFAFYEEGIAKCSFQQAYINNETDFQKPISCHLFPVRISGKKRNIIRYEEISECEDALAKGKSENITIFEFAKDAFVREYGEQFYKDLKSKYFTNKESR
ncbi:MAG TPA: DUF3109 family protein [Ignavibacteria bacterium]|nr:DUF3109 family protein [Ignavibacteria bacterium]HMR39081.1 DUF3109 family protein [Ignavibacteria bacterium]